MEPAIQPAATQSAPYPDSQPPNSQPPHAPSWGLPLLLIFLTYLSTTYVGAGMADVDFLDTWDFAAGAPFALPLMAILLAHEFGHYIAARRHGVPTSPPFFIPMPFFMLGTMGAVIVMRGRIRRRDALLDIGAAGPLAGLAIAIPVLIYGLIQSPVEPFPTDQPYNVEGRSLLYLGLLYLLKGSFSPGYDVFLSATALAGWAGLFITMINLLPIGQLDGGHIAYALFERKQIALSKRIRSLLPAVGILIALFYGLSAFAEGKRGEALQFEFATGLHWLTWWFLLSLLARLSRIEHPPTDPGPLSSGRRYVAVLNLIFFVLLFTPTWMRYVIP